VDHHHLARALYELDQSHTYCIIVENLSGERFDNFWKAMEENNEVYLKDQTGKEITPSELPTSIKDLSNDPFRSLAGSGGLGSDCPSHALTSWSGIRRWLGVPALSVPL